MVGGGGEGGRGGYALPAREEWRHRNGARARSLKGGWRMGGPAHALPHAPPRRRRPPIGGPAAWCSAAACLLRVYGARSHSPHPCRPRRVVRRARTHTAVVVVVVRVSVLRTRRQRPRSDPPCVTAVFPIRFSSGGLHAYRDPTAVHTDQWHWSPSGLRTFSCPSRTPSTRRSVRSAYHIAHSTTRVVARST